MTATMTGTWTETLDGHEGIRLAHSRLCARALSDGAAKCDCTPKYQALAGSIRHGDKLRQIRAHWESLEEAERWRSEERARLAAERERLRELRKQRKAAARHGTEVAARLAAEKRAATQEAQIAAVRAERQRMARLIRQLPPDLRGVERLYGHIRKGCQDAERAELAADGLLKMRLRAIYQSFREAEETLKVALGER